jgi:hypothetical protein
VPDHAAQTDQAPPHFGIRLGADPALERAILGFGLIVERPNRGAVGAAGRHQSG